jgi:hypothetical protein
LEQSEPQGPEPSSITHHSRKIVEKSNPDIELGPGKSYMESFNKKPSTSQKSNAAPGSQQEIPIAPPNVYKKENIPK